MTDILVQASFNSGEWSPTLHARVDLQRYASGAALLENFFVDVRGGASTRSGLEYVLRCKDSAHPVRLIKFQASSHVGYVLEFGNGYIRFIYNGSAVLRNSFPVTAATQANPCVITATLHDFTVGDTIYVTGINGMIQLNGRFYLVHAVAGDNVTLYDINNNAVNSTAYTAYTSGGTAAKVYEIASPYTSADDLRLIKFAYSPNQMVLCHPNHPAYVLTLITATNWTLVPITIGTTASIPTNVAVTTTLNFGQTHYSYGVTSIDQNGQESSLSSLGYLDNTKDLRSTAGSNQITWDPAPNALAYNVYASNVSYFGVIPYGVQYGFIGTCKSTTFVDSNIFPDFTETPPISRNPFVGSGVDYVTVTAPGAYTVVPTVSFTGTATVSATAIASLEVQGTGAVVAGGAGHAVNDIIQFGNSVVVRVTAVAAGAVTNFTITNRGSITSGATPVNPVAQVSTSGSGTGLTANFAWGVGQVIVTSAGYGYTGVPTVAFSAGAATATASLTSATNGYPTVPGFVQQRLVLAGAAGAPQTFHLSRPGSYYNFDISSPVKDDDSITGTLVSGVLNTIKSIVPSTAGMLILTDNASWLVNGGQAGSALSPTSIVANPQSFVGANDVPPIQANYDVLYCPSKGYGVRDLAFNIYYSVFTGTDISLMSNHLFFGYDIVEWSWSEQPFYSVTAVRNDGQCLALTFVKEQEFVGWSHYITNGSFQSTASVTEASEFGGYVDTPYFVVERTINGQQVKNIERFVERKFPAVHDSWCVDCSSKYTGSSKSEFYGGEFLAGQTVTGLSNGVIIPPFVMPADGHFTIPNAGTTVTLGIAYNCKLQTLAIDMGSPTIQSKVKKISAVDVRVANTIGLEIGQDFNHMLPMKDLVIGNVSSTLTGQQNQIVTGFVNGDARTILSPAYTVPGQYCLQQSKPYPASVLGVFPIITTGDK